MTWWQGATYHGSGHIRKEKYFPCKQAIEPRFFGQPVHSLASILCYPKSQTHVQTTFHTSKHWNSEWHSVYSISFWCYRVFVSQHVLFWKYKGYIFFTYFKLLYFTKKNIYLHVNTNFSTIYIYIIIVDGCNMSVINFQHSHKNLQTRLVKISQ
jgi:hypothetical protein